MSFSHNFAPSSAQFLELTELTEDAVPHVAKIVQNGIRSVIT